MAVEIDQTIIAAFGGSESATVVVPVCLLAMGSCRIQPVCEMTCMNRPVG
jgi:hypothetical protein